MLLLVDKPKGITSHDVVDRVREIVNRNPTSPSLPSGKAGLRGARIGHAGTLDPNATGLLIVGIGRETTKKLGSLSRDTKKEYIAEIVLGEERDTDDVLGKVKNSKFKNKNYISKLIIKNTLEQFIGEQEQVPPQYSAVKIKGIKAYELARKGRKVDLKSRRVNIYSIELLKYKYPHLSIKCSVSSGTYIRALARDIGKKLDCGAYLNNLRRTKIGKYMVTGATELDKLTSKNYHSFLVSMN